MKIRYFEIRSPRPDFTGKVGGVSFADGVARVSFDDERNDTGQAIGDEHQVQVGRSAVLFAQRRRGYTVTETDATGKPVDKTQPEPTDEPKTPTRGDSKATWKAYATSQGMPEADAEAMTRDQLAERYLGPKEA